MTTIIGTSTKKFAVLIGINYVNTQNELNGCINDAQHLRTLLIDKCGYRSENIVMLTDDINDKSSIMPTHQNIKSILNVMVDKAIAEGFTELWLSYSGHGSYVYDTSNDEAEADSHDEVICPVDYSTAGMIIDDYIYSNFVSKLPASTTLFSLMDCCHSGTICDLPYIYTNTLVTNNTHKHDATVISISGCKDDQTSADALINSNYEGAMTWSFINALHNANYNIKLLDLVERMKVSLANNYTQVPMLALSSPSDIDKYFIQSFGGSGTGSIAKSIKITMKVDYWYYESSWNLFSLSTSKYMFDMDKKFSSRYQQTETSIDLMPGTYKLCVKDVYGDGGVTSVVQNGLVTLVNAIMTSGKSTEYSFVV